MKILKRIKSAPELFRNKEFQDSIKTIKKSVSHQILTEFTQLSVEDAKHTNKIINDLGNNINEIAQSGIDVKEESNENSKISFTTLLYSIFIRLLVGSSVHYLHTKLEIFFKNSHIPEQLHIH